MNTDAIVLYEDILSGKIKKFPNGYFQRDDTLDNSRTIIRYAIRDKLKWSDKDIEENLTVEVLKKHKLYTIVLMVYNRRLREMVKDVFGDLNTNIHKPINYENLNIYELYEEVLSGKAVFPKNFWQSSGAEVIAIKLVKYLLKDKLKMEDNEISNVTRELLIKYKLRSAYAFFDFSKVKLLSAVFPELEIIPLSKTEQYRQKRRNIMLNLPADKKERIRRGISDCKSTKEYKMKISEAACGEKNSQHKLKSQQVVVIKQLWAKGIHSASELGDMYGVKRSTINDIIHGRTWKHIS